jgi:hypothetical protein
VDGSGIGSDKCVVSGTTVTITLNMIASEAQKTCHEIIKIAKGEGWEFEEGNWTLRIKSPYSGENAIAFCAL